MYFKEFFIYGLLTYSEFDLINEYVEEKYYIHSGVLKRYKEVNEYVERITKNTNKKIIFSGHSFGGTIASIASLHCKLQNPNNIVECYTYGSPAYCDYKTKELINNTVDICKRCYHINDPVVNHYFNWRFYAGGNKVIIEKNFNFDSNLKYHRLYIYYNMILK